MTVLSAHLDRPTARKQRGAATLFVALAILVIAQSFQLGCPYGRSTRDGHDGHLTLSICAEHEVGINSA